jgi:hypothetical protein
VSDIVQDVDRPDVGGVPPKMAKVRDEVAASLEKLMLPFLVVQTDDNLMSSVWIRGSFQPRTSWSNGIFHNSPYFQIRLIPAKGGRYYVDGADVEMELTTKCSSLSKLRKYTGPVAKVIPKLVKWVEEQPKKDTH